MYDYILVKCYKIADVYAFLLTRVQIFMPIYCEIFWFSILSFYYLYPTTTPFLSGATSGHALSTF